MHFRLYSFLTFMRLLYENQYGFQKGKSTGQAIFDIQESIAESLENGRPHVVFFQTLLKHLTRQTRTFFFRKFHYYGIRGRTYDWINSYLSNRKQCVDLNGNKSCDLPIDIGVPQRSILGHLLFLIYVNDLAESSKKLKFVMFADDTVDWGHFGHFWQFFENLIGMLLIKSLDSQN